MRHILSRLVILVFFSIGFVTCTNTNLNHPKLKVAKEMIDHNPDSALIILQEIDPSILWNQDQRMYRRLLIIEASDKAYFPTKNDKEISDVLNYFIRKNRAKEIHSEIFYYAGRSYSDLREDEKSLDFFNKALRELRVHPNVKLENCIHAQLGKLYSSHGLSKHLLREINTHVRLTDSIYNDMNDKVHQRERINARLTLAAAYRQARLIDSGLYVYNQLKPEIDKLNDSIITTIYCTQLALHYLHGNDYAKADSILQLAPKAVDRASLPSVESIFNLFAVRRDGATVNEKTTEELLSNSNLEIQYQAAMTLAKISQERKDGEMLLKYAQKIFEIDEKFHKEYNENALAEMEKILDQTQLENDNLMLSISNQKKEMWLIIAISSILLLIALIVIFYKNASQRQTQSKLEIEKIKNENSKHIKNLEEKIAALNELEKVYEENSKAEKREIEIQNKLQEDKRKEQQLEAALRLAKIREVILNKLSSPDDKLTSADLNSLRKCISANYAGFFDTLSKLRLSPEAVTDAMFIKIHLPIKLCALYFNKTSSAISNSRRRQFEKLCDGSSFNSWKDFILSIGEADE